MLSDAQWVKLEPLVDACRPEGKTLLQDLRRTLSASLWCHQNGAKSRAIPANLGPWWRAAQVFIRWARFGVWERLLALVQERGVAPGLTFLDGTTIRAHQKASGAARRGDLRHAIPTKRNEAAVACPDWIYNNRNIVERLWARLKEWRGRHPL